MADRGMSSALTKRLAALAEAPLRFPVPLACAVLWAGITVAREHGFDLTDQQTYYQVQVFLLLGLFLSLSTKLFAESRNWPIIRWLPLTAGALGLLALIVFLGPQARDAYESPAFLFMGPGLIMLMIVSPFLRRGTENHLIWDFNFKSWTSATFGLLVALVLALGMMAVFGALEALFGLNIPGMYYGDIWIVCLSVIWPWQTLAGVPGGFGPSKEEYCPRWVAYLISWLLVPLALIYLALLYAFAAKITLEWSLPAGQIGWLVGGFAGFGVAVWHIAHPLRETGNRLVQHYIRFFHVALFVPIVLLGVGIGTRIVEYGVTEKRYGLIVLILWLAGIAVHGVIMRAPRLNLAPVSFGALLILASFGPWGANAVSLQSQLARLDVLLIEAGVLRDGKLSKPAESVDSELAKRISSVIDYLNSPGKRQALSNRLGDGGIELSAGSKSVDIVASLGMEYINRWGNPNLQSWRRRDPDVMDLRGFDAAIRMHLGSGGQKGRYAEMAGSRTPVNFTKSGDTLEISVDGQGFATVDLAQIVETLKRYGNTQYNDAVNDPLMTVEAAGNGLRARIYFTTIESDSATEALKVGDITFIALIGAGGNQQ
jgi:hypothetical protein